jgi:hypothetical protein
MVLEAAIAFSPPVWASTSPISTYFNRESGEDKRRTSNVLAPPGPYDVLISAIVGLAA